MLGKAAYVGTARGELSIMVTPQDVITSVDLSIPNVAAFVLRYPTSQMADREGDIFYEMMGAVITQTVEYLKACGMPGPMVDELYKTLVKAAEEISDDDKADRTGSGGSDILERIIDLEPLACFEVRFPLPDGMIEALHHYVVTAGVKGRVRSTLAAFHTIRRQPDPKKLPANFQTNQNPLHVTQNHSPLKDLVRKFKTQQNKKLTGPLFVLVYDVNGRPVGVRSIKGPGWKGIGGKIASVDVVTIPFRGQDTEVTFFVNPSRSDIQRLLAKEGSCRAWMSADGNHLVAWDAYVAMHFTVAENYLKIHSWATPDNRIPIEIYQDRSVKITDASRHTKWFHNPEVAVVLSDSLALERALGGPLTDIGYWDEDINGPWTEMTTKTASKDVVELNGRDWPVFVNPSRTELQGLQTANHMCRAWLSGDGKTLVAWNGYAAVHRQVAQDYLQNFAWGSTNNRIPIEFWGKEIHVTDSVRQTTWFHSPELSSLLYSSPAVLRALGGPPSGVTYFDANEVGDWTKLETLKMASMGLAGWLLPDGTYLDVRSEGDGSLMHENIARRWLKEHEQIDLTEKDLDASDYAIEQGWIRLWVTPYGYVVVHTRPMTKEALIKLQAFFAKHPEWMAPGDLLIHDGLHEWNLSFKEFLASNTPTDLGRTLIIAKSKSARSFGPSDVPTNFWVVLDLGINRLDSTPEDFEQNLSSLQAGVLDGIKGISDTGQIVRMFGYRGAILRMPGQTTVELNNLSRVMYGSPAYLMSKNMDALYRIFDQRRGDKFQDNVILNLADYTLSHLKGVNGHAYEDLNYFGAPTQAARAYTKSPVDLSTPQALVEFFFKAFSESWHAHYTAAKPPFTQEDIQECTEAALRKVGVIYGSEGEWRVKNNQLQIPPGSTLVVGLDDVHPVSFYEAWWETVPPENQEFYKKNQWGKYKDWERAKKRDVALASLKALPYRVSTVSGPSLTQRIYELQANHSGVGTKSAAKKAKLFCKESFHD